MAIDAAAIAPLSEEEFTGLFDRYRQFADCMDAHAATAQLTPQVIGEKIAGAGDADAMIVRAKAVLPKDSPALESIDSPDMTPAQRTAVALGALTEQGTSHRGNRTQYLATMGTARLFVARAMGACMPDKEFFALLDKASQ